MPPAAQPVRAFVDNRERELLPLLSPWPARQLPVADIWIGLSGEEIAAGGVLIERKTTDDLEASILDGRYREQRTRLASYAAARGARVAYVIEGEMDRLWGKLTKQTLQKYLTRLALRYGVAVFHTETTQGTADLCRLLASQMEEDAAVFAATDAASVAYSSTVSVNKRGNKEDPRLFAASVLMCCPGVSAAVAEGILAACGGTLEGVWAATESELAGAQVGGGAGAPGAKPRRVGPAVARRLLGLLHGGGGASAMT